MDAQQGDFEAITALPEGVPTQTIRVDCGLKTLNSSTAQLWQKSIHELYPGWMNLILRRAYAERDEPGVTQGAVEFDRVDCEVHLEGRADT